MTGHFVFAAIKIAKLLIPAVLGLSVMIKAIVKSLWITIPAPTGPELTRESAPRLFSMLDEISSSLKSPRFHRVLINDEFNAGVLQVPRLGLFGFQQNFLRIGLPLMQALPPEQFRAVIAHEFGHLSKNHSRFSGWIYRLRNTWFLLMAHLHEGILFTPFFNWYAPYFFAYTFVLARANEYVADQCSAETVGKQTAAEALARVAVLDNYLEAKFWPSIYVNVNTEQHPTAQPFTAMSHALSKSLDPKDSMNWLEEAFETKTDLSDTHPCLADRLAALGYARTGGDLLDAPALPITAPQPIDESAASRYLGTVGDQFAVHLDGAWQQNITREWQERHAKSRQLQDELTNLDRKSESETLTEDEAWKRVVWTRQLKGADAAFLPLTHIIESFPRHLSARLMYGQVLLEKDDLGGVQQLEEAMRIEPRCTVLTCRYLARYWRRRGNDGEARVYATRAKRFSELSEAARRERMTLTSKDQFITHDVSPEDLAQVQQLLQQWPGIQAAFLIRKHVLNLPEVPCLILGLVAQPIASHLVDTFDYPALALNIQEQISLPGDWAVHFINGEFAWLRRACESTPHSQIYPAGP